MTVRNGERIQNLNIDFNETGIIIDISTSGIAILASKEKRKDSVLTIILNENMLKTKVIYSMASADRFRLGMQFINTENDSESIISDLVEKFSKGIAITCSIADES